MKISLKTKIAFWWWQRFRFKEPENKFQKISSVGKGIRSLLIILPREYSHLPLAQHFLKSLTSRGQFSAINKIIGWESQKDILDPQLMQRVHLISENDINKNGLLSEDKFGLLKMFVIHRILPKCKLKVVYNGLDICIILANIRNE